MIIKSFFNICNYSGTACKKEYWISFLIYIVFLFMRFFLISYAHYLDADYYLKALYSLSFDLYFILKLSSIHIRLINSYGKKIGIFFVPFYNLYFLFSKPTVVVNENKKRYWLIPILFILSIFFGLINLFFTVYQAESLSQYFFPKKLKIEKEIVDVEEITSTSTLIENDKPDNYYSCKNLQDGTYKCWIEGVSGDGVGECITFELASPLTRGCTFYIRNGYGDLKYYYDYNRVKEISIILNDKFTLKETLCDSYYFQKLSVYTFGLKKYTKPIHKITIRIDSVYKGKKFSDTCISEFLIDSNYGSTNSFNYEPTFSDPYTAELTAAYYRDIDKVLDVKIKENFFVDFKIERTELDILHEGAGEPYWVTWSDGIRNIFIVDYAPPFAIVPNQFLSTHDSGAFNIDIYTYKNGIWILDNDNNLYKTIREKIEETKKNKGRMDVRVSRDKELYIELDGKSYVFNVWKSLDEYTDPPSIIQPQKLAR